jgi:hypothetical protein
VPFRSPTERRQSGTQKNSDGGFSHGEYSVPSGVYLVPEFHPLDISRKSCARTQ